MRRIAFTALFALMAVLLGAVPGYSQASTTTSVSCTSPVFVNEGSTCTATVTNTSGPADPTGTVAFTITTGSGSFTGDPCTLDTGTLNDGISTCSVIYTPDSATPSTHEIDASYTPDVPASFNASSTTAPASIIVSPRATTTTVSCSPAVVFVDQTTTCTITVEDITPQGTALTPTGSVSVSTTGAGTFTNPGSSCTLSGVGGTASCTVDYTPNSAVAITTTHSITGNYASGSVHSGSSGTFGLIVNWRSTNTSISCTPSDVYVDQETICTVTVTDTTSAGAASTPTGVVDLATSGSGIFCSLATNCNPNASPPIVTKCTLSSGKCSVKFTPSNGLSTVQSIQASYNGGQDLIHAGSSNNSSLTVKKRQTETTISCTSPIGASAGSSSCSTVTVKDVTPAGFKSPPKGEVTFADSPAIKSGIGSVSPNPCSLSGSGSTSSCSGVTYTVSDDKSPAHSLLGEYKPDPSEAKHGGSAGFFTITLKADATTVSLGLNVIDMITALNAACLALETAGAAVGLIPDFDASDGVAFALFLAATVLCQDTDGDGLPDTVELFMGLDPLKVDSDFDAFGDGDEIAYAAGMYGRNICPSPGGIGAVASSIDSRDSDGDNLMDGWELSPFQTEPCNPDTDGDGLSDGREWATSLAHNAPDGSGAPDSDGFLAASSLPGPFSDPRDHSNPLMQDTDGDGLSDALEIAEGCSGISDGFVNSADSDEDGLPDGQGNEAWPDVAESAGNQGELNDDGLANMCDPDSDGDGLNDQAEVSLGTSPTDWDSDDDGLSDEEEVNTYSTDPNSPDSDGDGADGVIDVRVPIFDPILVGHSGTGTIDCKSDCEEALSFSSQGNFVGDPLDETDPLQLDTDGDGINDNIEFNPGCNGGSDGFANSFDSDDDGVRDGNDTEADVIDSVGNDGELNDDVADSICDPDSDGDGLLDGEEGNLGLNELDWDSDNDGLSDWEETQIYFTDPNNPDTDGDTADGVIAARVPASLPVLLGHSGVGTIACLSDCEESFSSTEQFNSPVDFRDETDPLQADTDGDGINDDLEFTPGCSLGADGFANSFDSDGDGASDGVEFTGIPALDGDIDPAESNDGELNDDALNSICDPDSDGDGLQDGLELSQGTDMRDWDSDDDGLSDREEVQIYFTDPNSPDTDGDGADGVIATRTATFTDAAHPALGGYAGGDTIACLSDCEEVFSGTLLFNPFAAGPFGNPLDETDPLQQDTDGDGITDDIEFAPGCNDGPGGPGTGSALMDGYANSFDSDADGLRDKEDAVPDVADAPTPNKTPVIPDPNNQGELEVGELVTGICDPDSDGDGILDGEEFQIGTDPYDWDTDNDGRDDGEFLGEGPIPTDPFDFDTDNDGIGDGVEVFGANTTNPVNVDTDGDGLCDGGAETPFIGMGNPLDPRCYMGVGDHPNPNGFGEDRDGDGVLPVATIGDSFSAGCTPAPGACETDPNNPDSDSDGILDGVEALAFSTTRSTAFIDERGRPTRAVYPSAANPPLVFSCLNPLDADSDDDGLTDGFEDANQDGNWDFLVTDFDFPEHAGSGGMRSPDPEETNPCDPDTDHDSNPDSVNSFGAAGGNSSDAEERQRGTNPLDFDSDNDLIDDGVEVAFVCVAPAPLEIDNDNDGLFNEDPLDGIDNDGDGLIDEDPEDFTFITVPNLDPNVRDSDTDGIIDGLEDLNLNDQFEPGIGETNPCASPPIPIVAPVAAPREEPVDTDGDGFADEDERAAGTDPNDPDDHPTAFVADLDRDGIEDDRLWLEDPDGDGVADAVALDINSNGQVDARIEIIPLRDFAQGDFDEDGAEDDCRYIVVYALSNYRALQPRIVLTIYDFNCDLVIDKISLD